MGHKPMTLDSFEEYARVCRELLDGATTDFTSRGRTTRSPCRWPISVTSTSTHRVPIYISGFGPRLASVGRSLRRRPRHVDPQRTRIREPGMVERPGRGANEAGRTLDRSEFLTCSLTAACVLRAGEDLRSERVIDTLGALVISGFHYAYENVRNYGAPPPRHLADDWDEYCALVESVPESHTARTNPRRPLCLARSGRAKVRDARAHQERLSGWKRFRDRRAATSHGGRRTQPGDAASVP